MSLLWGVGLAIGFILLQTKQTNLGTIKYFV